MVGVLLMPVAYKIQVEAARAAALAAHSAAGLVAQAKRSASAQAASSLGDALRLLRSAEATARAAVAALSMPSQTGGAGGGGGGDGATGPNAAKSPTRRRRRRKRNTAMDTQEAADDGAAPGVAPAAILGGGAGGGGVAAVAAGVVATSGEDLPDDSWADGVRRSGGDGVVAAPTDRPVRALAKQTSRERSPRASGGRLAAGTAVKVVGLANRFELNGCTGVLVPQDVPGGDGGRYNVKLDTGTCVRVQRANLEVFKMDTSFSFSR